MSSTKRKAQSAKCQAQSTVLIYNAKTIKLFNDLFCQ